jgi:hypothetical protein
MADKLQKIREEVERMHNLLPVMDGDNISVNYADRICTTLEMYIDSLQEEPVSEELVEEVGNYIKMNGYDCLDSIEEVKYIANYFAKWGKNHLWKPADGEDLPEIEREVVVFTQNFPDDAGIMRVAIAHRPDPKGWDGKSIATGKVEHYTPKTYGKGGWNIPDVVMWLDLDIPKLEED